MKILWILFLVLFFCAEGFSAKQTSKKCDDFYNKLLRGHRATWIEYVEHLVQPRTDGIALFKDLIPTLEKGSPAFKKALEKKVIELYLRAPKEGQIGERTYFPPRRTLDAILSILWEPHAIFREEKNQGNPKKALEEYFKITNKAFKDLPNGKYKAEEVLQIAKSIEDVLKKNKDRFPNARVEMFGSFPNGRATLGHSDLDVRINPQTIEAELLPLIQGAVDKIFNLSHTNMTLRVSPINMGRDQPLALYASTNPVTIDITPQRSQLEIYSSFPMEIGSFGILDADWKSPDIYPLNF